MDLGFQRISLAEPGTPVSKDYMTCSIRNALFSAKEGRTISLEKLESNLAKRRKEAFG